MCVSTGLFTHALKINIHWSFKPNAKLEKLVFALDSFLAPKAKDSTLVCRAAASLQPLHLLLSEMEKRVTKRLLYLSPFHPLVLLPSLSFQPPWLTSPIYISSAFCNKKATILSLFAAAHSDRHPCLLLCAAAKHPPCLPQLLHPAQLSLLFPAAIQAFLHLHFVFLSGKHLSFQSISRSQTSLFCADSPSLLMHCDTLASLFTLFKQLLFCSELDFSHS